jgi:hypothetical protein
MNEERALKQLGFEDNGLNHNFGILDKKIYNKHGYKPTEEEYDAIYDLTVFFHYTYTEYPFPKPWNDPTPEDLCKPEFEAIWQCIKTWDINVPGVYEGYMGATGNHVRAILEALELT